MSLRTRRETRTVSAWIKMHPCHTREALTVAVPVSDFASRPLSVSSVLRMYLDPQKVWCRALSHYTVVPHMYPQTIHNPAPVHRATRSQKHRRPSASGTVRELSQQAALKLSPHQLSSRARLAQTFCFRLKLGIMSAATRALGRLAPALSHARPSASARRALANPAMQRFASGSSEPQQVTRDIIAGW